MLLLATTHYFQVNYVLDKDFNQLQKRDFEQQMVNYKTLLNNFIINRKLLLNDLSEHSIFVQSVLQPEAMKDNLRDYLDELKVAGKQIQIALLDFEGSLIHASKDEPILDYQSQPWVEQIISHDKENYFEISRYNNQFFITLAAPVKYNQLAEGILLFEIPVNTLNTTFNWQSNNQSERIELYFNHELFIAFGQTMQLSQYSKVVLDDFNIEIIGYLDNSNLLITKQQIINKITLITGILALVIALILFIINQRILILPLKQLRKHAGQIANQEYQDNNKLNNKPLHSPLSELFYLTKAVEQMTQKIIARENALLSAKMHLEKRVDERTRDLNIATQKALAASKAKSDFLANMSHEIRTPINGVIGMAHLLESSQLQEEQKSRVRVIKNSGENLLSLVNDILDFSKAEAGKMDIEEIDFNINHLLNDHALLFSEQADDKNVELICPANLNIYPAKFKGDPNRIGQILTNLINNAIKFSESGEVTVSCQVTPLENNNNRLIFNVTDNGIGLSKEQQELIFKRFSQADTSTTREYGGTGLGLAICKQLVELMGGEIGVESKLGKGALFWFSINLPATTTNIAKKKTLKNSEVIIINNRQTYCHLLTEIMTDWQASFTIVKDLHSVEQAIAELSENTDKKIKLLIDANQLADNFEPFVEQLSFKYPNIQIVALATHRLISNLDNVNFVSKPLKQSKLYQALSQSEQPNHYLPANIKIDQNNLKSLPKFKAEILVADDNAANQLVAQGILSEFGVNVDIANNGEQAVEAVNKKDYDLIFMDCQMPKLDGYQATINLRDKQINIPIIALTANHSKEDKEKCADAGMNDFIVKPVDPTALYNALHQWLPQKVIED